MTTIDSLSVTCPHCGGAVPAGAFCANCGSPLPVAPVAPAPFQAAPAPPVFPGAIPTQAQTDVLPTASQQQLGSAVTIPSVSAWRSRLSDAQPLTRSLVALGVVILGAGAAVTMLHSEKHTLTGSLSLSDSSSFGSLNPGDSCQGSDGYDDIVPGAQVVVTDQSGKTLQTGVLGAGSYDGSSCDFDLKISNLPDASFYRLQIGRETRGTMQYSLSEMKRNHWQVSLTLGDD